MFQFENTKMMNVTLKEDQYKQISSKSNIIKALDLGKAIGFDILKDNNIIGFAMLRKYDEGCYFLWDYAIDYKYQNNQFGTKALLELIEYFKVNYSLREMSTTYIFGNTIAARVYEKVGFVTTDIVDEDDIHEVNMLLTIR